MSHGIDDKAMGFQMKCECVGDHWNALARKAASLQVSTRSPLRGYSSVKDNVQVTDLSYLWFCGQRYAVARRCNLSVFSF